MNYTEGTCDESSYHSLLNFRLHFANLKHWTQTLDYHWKRHESLDILYVLIHSRTLLITNIQWIKKLINIVTFILFLSMLMILKLRIKQWWHSTKSIDFHQKENHHHSCQYFSKFISSVQVCQYFSKFLSIVS